MSRQDTITTAYWDRLLAGTMRSSCANWMMLNGRFMACRRLASQQKRHYQPALRRWLRSMSTSCVRFSQLGPYHLLGWSFGGLVAHEMAGRLQEAHEDVALLALLDSYPPVPAEEALLINEQEAIEEMAELIGLDPK